MYYQLQQEMKWLNEWPYKLITPLHIEGGLLARDYSTLKPVLI